MTGQIYKIGKEIEAQDPNMKVRTSAARHCS